ncbi:hypothetical protein M422DRAFT_241053 [Sphaerobolus stellatus SS14]|nr:hypothetical protein M422DRAFT_241053 [Sphaerobolus stellatus SS14]
MSSHPHQHQQFSSSRLPKPSSKPKPKSSSKSKHNESEKPTASLVPTSSTPSPTHASSTPSESLHTLMKTLHHPNPPQPNELDRLFQGKAGEVISFLAGHVRGRGEVIWVRGEIERLKRLPRTDKNAKEIFGSESAVERMRRAEGKLAWTKAEVEKKRKELAHLFHRTRTHHQSEASSSTSEDNLLTSQRTTAVLLQTLKAKEEIRIARIESLRKIVGEMKERGRKADKALQPSLPTLLNEIRGHVPYGDDSAARPASKSKSISPVNLTPQTLEAIQSSLTDASSRLSILLKEISTPRPHDAFFDTLTLIRAWHNKLKRGLSESEAKSDIPTLRTSFFTSSPTPLPQAQVQSSTAPKKRTHSPDDDMDETLLTSLSTSLIRNRGSPDGPLRAAEALLKEKEQELRGYVNALRRRIVSANGDEAQQQQEKADPVELGLLDLRRIEEMIVQTAKIRGVLESQACSIDVPGDYTRVETRVLEEHLAQLGEKDAVAVALLRRKNGKMTMADVVKEDMTRFLAEGEALVSNKLKG